MLEQLVEASGRDVSRETFERLSRFVDLLIAENSRQNLVSPSSISTLWNRHILDGAQLLRLAKRGGKWCDVGSGPGLPGLVIAILGGTPMTLVEPRRLRAEFLEKAVAQLGLEQVEVFQCKAEQMSGTFDYITARAVARLDKLFAITTHLARDGTKWILPKGETVKSELDEARRTWQGSFRLVPSQTHEPAAILVADHVRRRGN
jgi:16S rRNA (guanine527-N7)-methyltransferase